MKYLIDKALSPKTVKYLRKKGYNVVRLDEILSGSPIEDETIFQYVIEQDYFIITADLDFGEILYYTQKTKPSVIILRLKDQRVDNVNDILAKALPKLKDELKRGSIVIVEDEKIRVRSLPI